MPRFLLYSIGVACFIAGFLSYLLFNSNGCGQSKFTDNDSLKVALAFSEGVASGKLQERVRFDSLLKATNTQNVTKATKSEKALATYIPKSEKKDSVLQTASVEDQNKFLKDLLDLCDNAARSLIDERNGLRVELEMAYGRIEIGNSIEEDLMKQKAILKNIVENLEKEVARLSKPNFWKDNQFAIGVFTGASATVVAGVLMQ